MPTVGVISDTHDLLRPEAVALLRGVDHIVHAGDIGSAHILDELRRIAPLTAVRGNNDRDTWAKAIPESQLLDIAGRRIYIVHDIAEFDVDPVVAGIAVVISGHSHKAAVDERDGVLFLNPGSAGPRRFKLPITLATLRITARTVQPQIHEITLAPSSPARPRST